MKKLLLIVVLVPALFLTSCFKEKAGELGGDQSPMGEVGITVSSSSMEIAGVSNFNATVTALKDGVSSYTATATVTNPLLKNIAANYPGVEVNGDQVSVTNVKIQQTKEGIKSMEGPGAGVLVKYDSKVGDTYPIEGTDRERKVVSKSTDDDYYYGFFLIKTIQVEMDQSQLKSSGITKYTYIANHKFGLVGVKVDFDDQTSVTFPIYTSAEN
ncbi:MAG: hypothetical protein RBS55_05965 [Bacteroidales bacterium]|nr:hypothetical protein [Bacteroidales bacterium]